MSDQPTSSPPSPPSSPPSPPSSPPSPASVPPSEASSETSSVVVLRKDPERRATMGLGLGRGLALLAVLASLVPALVVAVALWPGAPSSSASASASSSGVVDFAALRAAVTARGTTASAASPAPAAAPVANESAPSTAPTASTASMAATSGAQLAFDPARVAKARGLIKRVFKARDARRAAGATLPELRKPFTIVELGGNVAISETGIAAGKRLLMSRDGKVIAPAGAAAPEGVELVSKERDEDVLEADATLDGQPVRVMRRCLAGELLCLVDIEARAASAPAPSVAAPAPAAAAPSLVPSGAQGAADAALLALLDIEERKTSAGPSFAPGSTRLPPWTAAALGVVLALLLGGALAFRLVRTGSLVTATAHRLRALAAGRPGPAPVGVPVEIAALHVAIDECAEALGDARARAAADEARRLRLAEVGSALERARQRSDARVAAGTDEAATGAIVAAANALLEAFEERVVRWKSHVDAVGVPPDRISSVEARAQALATLPPLLVEVAQRLLRLARVPELPTKAQAELNALGEALASRGRTAQTLVDQLLLDAATDRPGDAPQAALAALRQELDALSPSAPVHATVAALRDLPLAELASRVSSSTRP